MYVSADEIYLHWQQNKSRPLNFQNADEAELEKAMKASLAEYEKLNQQDSS